MDEIQKKKITWGKKNSDIIKGMHSTSIIHCPYHAVI